MSKKLEKRANHLVRKAEDRAVAIRRAVREFRDAAQKSDKSDAAEQFERHREIERAVNRYTEVHKALKRIRKRIQLKNVDTRRPAIRASSR